MISSSHDSLIIKLNNSSTHFSVYQHKPFDSPPASHSSDLTSTTVHLFYSDFWFQLRNTESQVPYWSCYNCVPIPTYLDPSAPPRWALLPRPKPCSCYCASVLRRALQAETHQKNTHKKKRDICLMMFFDVLKVFVNMFFNLCSTANGLLYDWDLGMKKETDSRDKLSEG